MHDFDRKICWKCHTGINDNHIIDNLMEDTPFSFLSCVGCSANEFMIKEKLNSESNRGINIRYEVRNDNDLNNFVFLNSDSVIKITKNRFTYHYSKSETIYTTMGRLLRKVISDLQYYLNIEIKNSECEIKEKLWNHLDDDEKMYDDALLEYEDSSFEDGDIYFCNDEASNVNSAYSSSFFEGMERSEIAKFNHRNLDQIVKDKCCELFIVDFEGVSRIFGAEGFSNEMAYDNIDVLNGKNVHHSWLQ